jgi:PKD repeat protein
MLYDNIHAFENAIPAYAADFMMKCSDLKLNIMNKRKYVEDGITKYTFTVNNPNGTKAKTYEITIENRVDDKPNITCSCPSFKYNQYGTCKHVGHLIYYIFHVYDTDVFEMSRLSFAGLERFIKLYDLVDNNPDAIHKLCKEIDPSLPDRQPMYPGPNAPMTPPRVERVRECPDAPERSSRGPFNTPLFSSMPTSNPTSFSLNFNQEIAYNNAKSYIDRAINLVTKDILSTHDNLDELIEEKLAVIIKSTMRLNM